MVLLYFLITDGSSDSQSPFSLRKTGFFIRLCIVLLNSSANTAPRSVFLEYFNVMIV